MTEVTATDFDGLLGVPVVARPGDVVFLTSRRHLTSREYGEIKDLLKDVKETTGVSVVLLDPNVEVARMDPE